jgi:cation diffusion facilitator family transporter
MQDIAGIAPQPVVELEAQRHKRAVALSSVLAAVVLTGLKLGVGLATNSLGILAEAVHSGLDLVAALLTWFAVRLADKPADAEHPYGHGKVENLSALFETGLLLVTCVWIIYEAVQRLLFQTVHVEASVWAFLVMIVSIIVDVSRSRALTHAARKYESQALEADALHFSTDIWSSAVVILGLALVKLGELTGQTGIWTRADAVAALGVAGIVIVVSLRLGKATIDALLDTAPPGLSERIATEVRAVPGVVEVRRVRLRRAGSRLMADLVIAVPRTTTFAQSHAINDAVEEAVRRVAPHADVVVHAEPVARPDETPVEQIHFLARQHGVRAHDVRVRQERGQYDVDLHVEVDEHMTLERAHALASAIEREAERANRAVRSVNIHLEAPGQAVRSHEDVTATHQDLVQQVIAIADAVAGPGSTHEVRVYHEPGADGTADGHLHNLVLHCTFPGNLTVPEVHERSTEVERALRARLPGLGTVLVHAEPEDAAV